MHEAYYYFIQFESDSVCPNEVEAHIRIMEPVIDTYALRQRHKGYPDRLWRERKRKCDRMNRVILMGRLTRDPEVRYSQGERSMAIARYTLAVDRRGRRGQDSSAEQQTADFINYVAFDRAAEFAEKYFRQGMWVLVRQNQTDR